jgi:DNA-binding MarR family transcriptional regulator
MNEFSRCPTEGAIGLFILLINSGKHAESRLDDALMGGSGLTFVKWRTLDALVKASDALPLKDLPDQLHCVKSNVTQLIDKLEADNLVRRIADPEDRRGTRVELTETGQIAHHRGREALETTTRELFNELNHNDQESLRAILQSLDH